MLMYIILLMKLNIMTFKGNIPVQKKSKCIFNLGVLLEEREQKIFKLVFHNPGLFFCVIHLCIHLFICLLNHKYSLSVCHVTN